MEAPPVDVEAHMEAAPPKDNKNGRAFLDKWMGEIVRLSMVIIVSLAVSYFALTQAQQQVKRDQHSLCHAQQRIAENQRTVLLVLLRLTDYLSYDITPGNSANNLSQREQILQALALLPDPQEC